MTTKMKGKQFVSYKICFEITSYKLQVKSYKIQVTSFKIQVTSHKLNSFLQNQVRLCQDGKGKSFFLFFYPRQPTELQCFVKGECQEGKYLGSSISTNADDCHNYCHQLKDCKWFTYRPSSKVCQAFSKCSQLNSSVCQDCISGEVYCKITRQCGTQGMCKGSLLSTVVFIIALI